MRNLTTQVSPKGESSKIFDTLLIKVAILVPHQFKVIIYSLAQGEPAHILQEEIDGIVPHGPDQEGFYTRYFQIQKKEGEASRLF